MFVRLAGRGKGDTLRRMKIGIGVALAAAIALGASPALAANRTVADPLALKTAG